MAVAERNSSNRENFLDRVLCCSCDIHESIALLTHDPVAMQMKTENEGESSRYMIDTRNACLRFTCCTYACRARKLMTSLRLIKNSIFHESDMMMGSERNPCTFVGC